MPCATELSTTVRQKVQGATSYAIEPIHHRIFREFSLKGNSHKQPLMLNILHEREVLILGDLYAKLLTGLKEERNIRVTYAVDLESTSYTSQF